MSKQSSLWFTLVVVVLAAFGGKALLAQRQQATLLRVELAAARFDIWELQPLRAENTRLHERQISTVELERLRADHTALPRLRAEFEALNKR